MFATDLKLILPSYDWWEKIKKDFHQLFSYVGKA